LVLGAVGQTTISSIQISNPEFAETDDCVGTLSAGQACYVEITFSPTGAGFQSATVTINSNAYFASNANTVTLEGKGAAISASGSLAFGSVAVGNVSNQTVTLTNNSNSNATITKIALTETIDFSINGSSTCKVGILAGKASCTIIVTFAPQSTGAKSGQLQVFTSDPSPILIGMSGTGTVGATAESFTPNPVTFANPQLINTSSAPQTVTFKYTGTGTLTLTSIVSNNTQFILVGNGTGGACNIAGGTALTNGQSCTFTVTFKPTSINGQNATITANYTGSSDGSTSDSLPASGTGTDVKVPTKLTFLTIVHGNVESANLKVTNASKTGGPTLHVTGTNITGPNANLFTVTNNGCSAGAAPGKSCNITIQFAPTAAGSFKATITLTTDGGSNPSVALSGKAT
jgi:Abnormal spindle-like microcephaly-assoc'd, ASPM-SPD-2-Hydin